MKQVTVGLHVFVTKEVPSEANPEEVANHIQHDVAARLVGTHADGVIETVVQLDMGATTKVEI